LRSRRLSRYLIKITALLIGNRGGEDTTETKAKEKGMRQPKWHLCAGGFHLWPDHLQAVAPRCCRDRHEEPNDVSQPYTPYYLCSRGKHLWSRSDDALRCCNGYLPVWQTLGGPIKEGNIREVWRLVLVPTSDITDMDERASCPDGQPHLYLPM